MFLGGRLLPIGCTVAFIDQDIARVREAVIDARPDVQMQMVEPRPVPDCLAILDPMEAPWTAEVLIDCGRWTTYLNNDIDGGDITAIAPAVARALKATCVSAEHVPPYGPGHASTQLWIAAPDGEPPLMYRRTISAHCQDGRWSWYESGVPEEFERPERYRARRVRDRLDRELLVEYLASLGIAVDDPAFYGLGYGLRQLVDWHRRQLSAAAWRQANGY